MAQAGQSFVPVEGNTGTNARMVFMRQDGTTWCVAVFNYSSNALSTNINLTRAGISGNYIPVDLWSGAATTISNGTFSVDLNAKQSKLFRLFTIPTLTSPQAGPNHSFNFTLNGDAGHTYTIQASNLAIGAR